MWTEQDKEKLQDALAKLFPYASCRRSTLGGEARASILIAIGLDAKETWYNNIFENSRYARIALSGNVLEYFSGNLKFRKVSGIDSIEKAIEKLTKWKVKNFT